ncbi:MAG: hypothetical protein R2855_10765 [Thermomicrobiales bacterium]
MLLAAASFLPRDFAKVLSAELALGEVFYLLSDEQLPAEYRENMRQVLHLLAEQARMRYAARAHGPGFGRRLAGLIRKFGRRLRAAVSHPLRTAPEPAIIFPASAAE